MDKEAIAKQIQKLCNYIKFLEDLVNDFALEPEEVGRLQFAKASAQDAVNMLEAIYEFEVTL